MKKSKKSVPMVPLSSEDFGKFLSDFDTFKKMTAFRLDRVEESVNGLRTRMSVYDLDNFSRRMDQMIGILETIRREQTIMIGQYRQQEEKVGDLDRRLVRVERP